MKKSFLNDLALWHSYMNAKVPMLVRKSPKSWGCAEFVVVPASSPRFVIGDFDSAESALHFCKKNGIPAALKGVAK